ncbi:hypothetical protein [Empedobacter falsenii]
MMVLFVELRVLELRFKIKHIYNADMAMVEMYMVGIELQKQTRLQ